MAAPSDSKGLTWRLLGARLGDRHILALPAKELKKLGLTQGDVLLLRANGCQTVAACEAGGREGGLLLSSTARLSLAANDGDEILAISDFEAEEAAEICLEISSVFAGAWSSMAGGLELNKYLKAVLDGTLLCTGDIRNISLNGQAWEIRISGIQGKAPLSKPRDADDWKGPWLATKKTSLRVTSKAESRGEGSQKTDPWGFSLVGGLSAVIEELREAVQFPLQNPKLYRQMGISPPRGVLLYGPPGTGKTLLARSLAEELDCPCELMAATDLVGTGVGESEERIKSAFESCRQQAFDRGTGALLFIDEVDAVCPKRDDASEVERRMVAAFLTALDEVHSGDSVVVLGATNRPDAIDPALRRAGRLEREIEVGVPNSEERLEILHVHLSKLRHSLSEEQQRELARRCHGYVGADLRALCTGAARGALRRGKEQIDLECCFEACRQVPPSALKELLVEVPEVTWDDIGGYEKTKEALKEAVEWPIQHAWAFESMSMEAPRGVLLYGPPGCSKTMMAKAVATETEMNFISVKGPELFSKYVGESERAVREVFRKARAASPCVIFFDEVDSLGGSRESEGGGVASRVLAQLLAEMDGIGVTKKRHVVVLAATNRPQALDAALTRPGRFDRLVHVPLPDQAAREAIFQRQLSRMQVSLDIEATFLASQTAGYSGAEVVMVCREAALLAIRKAIADGEGAKAPCATLADFNCALRAVQPRITTEMAQFYEDFERRMQRD